MPRSLDNWMPYYDKTNKPLFGRLTFYKLHTTEKQPIYNEDGTVPLPNPISTSQYGMTDVQVFLQDADYTVKVEKWIGAGEYTLDDPNVGDWEDVRTFDNLYPAIPFDTPEGVANVVEVSTMADLRAVDVSGDINYAKLLGYRELGDMPPQYYKLINSPSATIQDDGGSIIRPEGSTSKVWMLIPQENIDVRVFGVFPTQAISIQSSDTSNIHNCFTYANNQGKDVYLPQYYTGSAYYWIEGGTHSIWQKMVVDKGVHIVAKPLTTSRLIIGEIQYYGDQLFISSGTYGQLTVDCNTVKTSWKCNGWANWPGTVKKFIVDKLNSAFTFENAIVEFVNDISGHDLTLRQCLITSDNHISNCTLTLENCDRVSDFWIYTNVTLRLIGNVIKLSNFSSAQTYVEWKNIQGESNYGDLGEQTISNVILRDNAIVENAQFTNVGVHGNLELHNVSGTIYTTATDLNLNAVDCWLTITGQSSVAVGLQIRRGNLSCNNLQVLNNLYLDDVDINSPITCLGATSNIRNSRIHGNITATDITVFNNDIYATISQTDTNGVVNVDVKNNRFYVGGYHSVNPATANTIVNGYWVGNEGLGSVMPVLLNRSTINPNEPSHNYVYTDNSGKFLQRDHIEQNVLLDLNPNSSGCELVFVSSNKDGFSYVKNAQSDSDATRTDLYFATFEMFSVGTENMPYYSMTAMPQPYWHDESGTMTQHKYQFFWDIRTIMLCDRERTKTEWRESGSQGSWFRKGFVFEQGYTWAITQASFFMYSEAVGYFNGYTGPAYFHVKLAFDKCSSIF